MSDAPHSTLDICGQRTLDYVVEALGRLATSEDKIKLRMVGSNVNKGMQTVELLQNNWDIQIENTETHLVTFTEQNEYYVPAVEVTVSHQGTSNDSISVIDANLKTLWNPLQGNDAEAWIDYPVYHLLFSAILADTGRLSAYTKNGDKLIELHTLHEKQRREQLQFTVKTRDSHILEELGECLYRSGVLRSYSWSSVADELSDFDDVILGLDTNVLLESVVTEQLLNSITLLDPREVVHTPNWILFVVPSTVLRELEQAANSRNDDEEGRLTKVGRMGYRGMQELLEIEQSADLPGISLLITGGAIPELDTRYELQGLRKLRGGKKEKESSNDMIIRDQFKTFVRESGFNKGVFFVTSDKSNASLAETEGLNGILYSDGKNKLKRMEEDGRGAKTFSFPYEEIHCKIHDHAEEDKIVIISPIGKLLYELCVQFGDIDIKANGTDIRLKCDQLGHSLDHWHLRQLICNKQAVKDAITNYWNGAFQLSHIKHTWQSLNEKFISVQQSPE